MALPTAVPQDPTAREIMRELLQDAGVLSLDERDAKEFILRLAVTSVDWLMILRGLNRLTSEQRDSFFKQVFDEGEFNSYKAGAFLMLNFSDFQEFSIESIALFDFLVHALLGKEPE